MLSGNNFAVAKDITVSTGNELQQVITKATEPTKIQFANDIDISSLNTIPIGADAIEIDGKGNKLINKQDSKFTFVKGSSLALKNLKYEGKNASININNIDATILLENVDISGRTTTNYPDGSTLLLKGCDATLNNVSVSSSKVNATNKSISGGIINIQSAKSRGIITDLIDNQITAGIVTGGLIYNRRTPDGELSLEGKVNENIITANSNISGGILNNEGSSIQSINWKDVEGNKVTNTNGSVTGGFIQNKRGMIASLEINSFSNNTISSNFNIDGGLIYNGSGAINKLKVDSFVNNTISSKSQINGALISNPNGTLEIGQIVENTIKANNFNGLITNISGNINSILIDSVSNNKIEINLMRGGVIKLQGANVKEITIGEVNNNKIRGNENSSAIGFILYLIESPIERISSNIESLNVGKIQGNEVEATNITSLLFRSALETANVTSKNGNITVGDISDNNLTAIDCNDNARGGIIYNFLYGGLKTKNTIVSIGDINLKNVSNNHLESTITQTSFDSSKLLNGRHASGAIIANSIQSNNGYAIIKSIDGKYIGNSVVSNSEIMGASGGVISNSVNGLGDAFVGIGYTLDENNEILSVKEDAILGTYEKNYVKSEELAANGGVIANYVESSLQNDIAQIRDIKANFSGNYVVSKKNSAYGGAISNFYEKSDSYYKNAIIDSINSTFENNYAQTESTDSSKGAYGGAISNTATIKAINNSVFKNNYAISYGGSNAAGGAIYTRQDLAINASNEGLTEFTSNYVSTDGGVNYEAINVATSGKTLTLNATTKGTILLNDYINGANGYNVLLTGDSTGTIKLFDKADIKGGANVTVNGNVVIDTADGIIQSFSEFNSLKSDANAKYNY